MRNKLPHLLSGIFWSGVSLLGVYLAVFGGVIILLLTRDLSLLWRIVSRLLYLILGCGGPLCMMLASFKFIGKVAIDEVKSLVWCTAFSYGVFLLFTIFLNRGLAVASLKYAAPIFIFAVIDMVWLFKVFYGMGIKKALLRRGKSTESPSPAFESLKSRWLPFGAVSFFVTIAIAGLIALFIVRAKYPPNTIFGHILFKEDTNIFGKIIMNAAAMQPIAGWKYYDAILVKVAYSNTYDIWLVSLPINKWVMIPGLGEVMSESKKNTKTPKAT